MHYRHRVVCVCVVSCSEEIINMAAYGSDLLCRTPGRVALKAGTQRLASSCVCSHVPVQARALPVSHFLFAAWTSPGSFLSLPSRGFQRAQCAQRLPVRQGQSLSCGHGPVENRTGGLWRHGAGGTVVAVEGLRKNTSEAITSCSVWFLPHLTI